MIDSDTLINKLRDRIVETRRGHVAVVRDGGCKDFSEYRFQCGYIAALQFVLDEIPLLSGQSEQPEAEEDKDGWNE